MPPSTKKPVYIRGSGSTHNVYEGDGVVRMGRFRHWHWGHVLIPSEKTGKKKTKHIHYVDAKGTITTERRPSSRDGLLAGVKEEGGDNGDGGDDDGGDNGGDGGGGDDGGDDDDDDDDDDGHGDVGGDAEGHGDGDDGHGDGGDAEGHGDVEGEPVDALLRLHGPDEDEDEDEDEDKDSSSVAASQTITRTITADTTTDSEASTIAKPKRKLYRYTDRHGNITVTRHRLSRTPPEIGWVYRDGTILLSSQVAKQGPPK